MSQDIYDLVVIGAGPGGEVGAIRAAQLGLRVAVVERAEHLGGTCLNAGCIPTKCLIESAKTWTKLQHAPELGFEIGTPKFQWDKIMSRKEGIVDAQRKGLKFLFKKNKIDLFTGTGSLKDSRTVEVRTADGKTISLGAKHTLIATGSRVRMLPFVKINGKTIHTSDTILSIAQVPKTLAIIGGGVVGMEFASLFGQFGSQVTVIELGEQVIPTEDSECAKELISHLRKFNVTVETSTKLTAIEDKGGKALVSVEGKEPRAFDVALMSIGREPVTDGLGLDKLGIRLDRGFVTVDSHYRTAVPNIFAIGDVIPTAALAHTASAEALHAVEVIAGHHPQVIDYLANPSAIYSYPEVASIGYTEAKLKEKGLEYQVAKFPFSPLAKAKIEEATQGFVKILYGPKHRELLGVHIVGAKATELIAEFSLGKILETTVDEIAQTIHPHPTLSETVMEAAHVAMGGAIHL